MRFSHNNSLISEEELTKTATPVGEYVTHLQHIMKEQSYGAAESSINLPSDKQMVEWVQMLKREMKPSAIKYIIDIGIGGSNLGTKAVYDALGGYFDNVEPHRFPKILFFDTNTPEFFSRFEELVKNDISSQDEVVINMISKSGGTTETVVNFEIVYAMILKKFPDIKSRIVITTDQDSKLWNEAQKQGLKCLPIPKQVGGRYSVLSAVGLLPLALAGIDIDALLSGAIDMRAVCTYGEALNNPALVSATLLYLNSKKGKTINDNFFFSPQLESLGKWYRQLMGESIGKENDLQGNTVHAGITPTVSVGSVDLHSVAQLYLGGPTDKFTTFVSVATVAKDATVPKEQIFPTLVEHIGEKSAFEIMEAIREGTKTAYIKKQLPFMELMLEELTPYEIGQYLQFKMIEMMYLGKLLNVNTFDQPQVELYKTETKRILKGE